MRKINGVEVLTKKEKFEMIAEIEEVKANPVLIEMVLNEIAMLEKKKNSSSNKATEKSLENERLAQDIYEIFKETNERVTVSEFQANHPEYGVTNGFSNPKVTALFRVLVGKGLLANETEKKKSYYFLANQE